MCLMINNTSINVYIYTVVIVTLTIPNSKNTRVYTFTCIQPEPPALHYLVHNRMSV